MADNHTFSCETCISFHFSKGICCHFHMCWSIGLLWENCSGASSFVFLYVGVFVLVVRKVLLLVTVMLSAAPDEYCMFFFVFCFSSFTGTLCWENGFWGILESLNFRALGRSLVLDWSCQQYNLNSGCSWIKGDEKWVGMQDLKYKIQTNVAPCLPLLVSVSLFCCVII